MLVGDWDRFPALGMGSQRANLIKQTVCALDFSSRIVYFTSAAGNN
jgi:hypothetical protein